MLLVQMATHFFSVIFILSIFLLSSFSILADDWEDLTAGEKMTVYGSEKSRKYPTSNLFYEREDWKDHYSIRAFGFYRYFDYPKFQSRTVFPVYNRVTSKIDNREKVRILNYTTKRENEAIDKTFFPFAFWGNDTKDNSKYHSLLPFYYTRSEYSEAMDYNNFLFIPFPYYSESQNDKKNKEIIEFSGSILHRQSTKQDLKDKKGNSYALSIPIIPIFYMKTEENSNKNRLFPIYGYSNSTSEKGKDFSFWFTLIPFYYSDSSYAIHKGSEHHETRNYNLLYFSEKEIDKASLKDTVHSSKFGFPIIPFLYYSNFQQGEGEYNRILTLYQSEKDVEGDTKSLSFFPFVFYKKNDYFYIPLVVNKDLSQPAAVSGKTFVPIALYYKKWDVSEEKTWFALYYSSESKVVQDDFTTIFPIYWKSVSQEKEWSIFLPLYAKYIDKEDEFHFNLLFLTRSKTGLLDPKFSVKKKEDSWYFDSDINILYYLFKISFRNKIEKPAFFRTVSEKVKSLEELQKEKKEISEKKPEEKEKENPKLSQKREFTREDSESFVGYSALFGIFSYEKADTKRHVRLLPLTWLTWDEASDEKVYVIPIPLPTVWYSGADLEYNIIFPLYGRQKDKDSERQAYLINAFWKENYKENNHNEYSIVWPFVNLYNSDKGSGHRVLPFYLAKTVQEETREVREVYSLFSFYTKTIQKDNSDEEKRSSITNLFIWPTLTFYTSKQFKTDPDNPDNPNNIQKNYTFFAPGLYRKTEGETFARTNILLFTDWKVKHDKLQYLLIFPFYKSEKFFFLFPITFTDYDKDIKTFTLFNYLHLSDNHYYYNFLFLIESYKHTNGNYKHNLLFRAVNLENTPTQFEFSGLWDFLWNFEKKTYAHPDGKESISYWKEMSLLWWLGPGYRNNLNSQTYNLSLLWIHTSYEHGYTDWFLGNYINSSHDRFYSNFLFLAEYEKNKNPEPGSTRYSALFRGFQWLEETNYFEFRGLWGFLWQSEKTTNYIADGKSESYWKEISFLWWPGMGYRNDQTTQIYNLSLFFIHATEKDSYRNWTLGNYIDSNPNSFYDNFLFLYEYEKFVGKEDTNTNLFLRSFGYEKRSDAGETRVNQFGLYGFLWDYSSTSNTFNLDMAKGLIVDLNKTNENWNTATFIWLGYTKESTNITHNYFPVYYTNFEEKKYRDIYGPLLRINSVDQFSRLDLGLLGVGYWYHLEYGSKQESLYIGLGSIYREFTEVQNGYRSRGSLWGFLWEYQSEEQTQFRKFSLLKLFSYTKEEDGRTKILGIEF